MYVIVAGNVLDRVTVYGPFATHEEAVEWANRHPAAGLSQRPWVAAPVKRIGEEGTGNKRWIIYNPDGEDVIGHVYDDYEECVADANQLDDVLIIAIHV